MARIRSVKPEFWGDRKLARLLSRDARLLYIAMWNQADEHGRLQGDTRYIKGACLPYDDDLGLADIENLIAEIESSGRLQRYEHDGDPFIYLPKLAEHQRLEPSKVPSRLPAPPDLSAQGSDQGEHPDADEAAPRSDESAPHAETNALLYVAGSMEQGPGSRGAVALRADDPQDDPTSRLLIEHVNAYAEAPPLDAQRKAKTEIMRQVAQGTPEHRIRAGLARLREKRVSASLLPELIAECSPVARSSTTDQRVASTLALAARYEEAGE